LAELAPDEHDDWVKDSLYGLRRDYERLRMTVPPKNVGQVEQVRPAGVGGAHYREQRLQVAIQVARWDGAAA
jgi:hypothetical protein